MEISVSAYCTEPDCKYFANYDYATDEELMTAEQVEIIAEVNPGDNASQVWGNATECGHKAVGNVLSFDDYAADWR